MLVVEVIIALGPVVGISDGLSDGLLASSTDH
jgi:hypothetical protein